MPVRKRKTKQKREKREKVTLKGVGVKGPSALLERDEATAVSASFS
jgi:hypothetical protein